MTMVAPPRVEFMTDAVAHWAAAQPDAEALTYGEVRWTWAQWQCHQRDHGGRGSMTPMRRSWPRPAPPTATAS